MIATAGVLALATCLVFPGLIFLQILRPQIRSFGVIALSVGLSLTANHFLVVALVLVGLYQRPVVVLIILFEVMLSLWLLLSPRHRRSPSAAGYTRYRLSVRRIVLFSASAAVFVYVFSIYLRMAFSDFGEIFTTWDTVVSWNRWAVEWTANRLPVQTWEYPQLLPTFWSMIYVLLGTTELQVFVKATMAWLPMVMFVVFANMALSGGIIVGTVGAYASLQLILLFPSFVLSGYTEVPSGIMGFLAFYLAWLASGRHGREAERLQLIGAALAAGSALTKQSGVFFALSYPLFAWLNSSESSNRHIWRSVGLLVLLTVPWYAYRFYAIRFGGDASNILVVTQFIHGGRNYYERIAYGIGLIGASLQGLLFYSVIVLLLAAMLSKLGRSLGLIVILPYVAIYCLFFSYDIRNLLPLIPIVAWGKGVGAANIVEMLRAGRLVRMLPNRRFAQVHRSGGQFDARPAWTAALAFVVLMSACIFVWAGRWPDKEVFISDYNRRLNLIGDAFVNQAVFDLIASQHRAGRILTNNGLLEFIPAVKPYYEAYAFGPWTTPEVLAAVVKTKPIIGILIFGPTPQLQPAIERWISKGSMVHRAGAAGVWQLLEVRESDL